MKKALFLGLKLNVESITWMDKFNKMKSYLLIETVENPPRWMINLSAPFDNEYKPGFTEDPNDYRLAKFKDEIYAQKWLAKIKKKHNLPEVIINWHEWI